MSKYMRDIKNVPQDEKHNIILYKFYLQHTPHTVLYCTLFCGNVAYIVDTYKLYITPYFYLVI